MERGDAGRREMGFCVQALLVSDLFVKRNLDAYAVVGV
jgi:hypothetical protein